MRMYSVLLLMSLTLTGCVDSGTTTDACSDLGLSSVKVMSGTQCGNANTSPVVRLEIMEDGDVLGICSGTVITPTEILSAAHCVSGNVDRVRVHVGGEEFETTRFVAHPGAEVDDEFISEPDEDISIIHLDQRVSVDPVPILVSRTFGEGERFSIFGYGLDEDNNSDENLKSGVMESLNVESGNIESEYTDESAGGCFGDSGGPAIAAIDPNGPYGPAVVGVASALSQPGPLEGGFPPFPFPAPIPFAGENFNCRQGAHFWHANIQLNSVTDFILEQAPDVILR